MAKGYVWEAWYDALGRRIQTEITQKLAGTLVPGTTQQERSWYDPLHELLEVAVERWSNSATSSVVTRQERVWKVHGPDSSGRYGGHNGIGGMEALLDDHTGQWIAFVEDLYGNIAGQIEQTSTTSTTIAWQTTQCAGYGPAPGSLTTTYTGFVVGSLAESTAWRGRRMDVTGFYYLGARYYEPGSGRFLSPDPAGHAASMSLYDYAGGDPVNFLDPDGRLAVAKQIAEQNNAQFGGRINDRFFLPNEQVSPYYNSQDRNFVIDQLVANKIFSDGDRIGQGRQAATQFYDTVLASRNAQYIENQNEWANGYNAAVDKWNADLGAQFGHAGRQLFAGGWGLLGGDATGVGFNANKTYNHELGEFTSSLSSYRVSGFDQALAIGTFLIPGSFDDAARVGNGARRVATSSQDDLVHFYHGTS